jgi:hypothetical protein
MTKKMKKAKKDKCRIKVMKAKVDKTVYVDKPIDEPVWTKSDSDLSKYPVPQSEVKSDNSEEDNIASDKSESDTNLAGRVVANPEIVNETLADSHATSAEETAPGKKHHWWQKDADAPVTDTGYTSDDVDKWKSGTPVVDKKDGE